MISSSDIVALYTELEQMGVTFWIDGGWCVDALVGRITRVHDDLDIALAWKDVVPMEAYLLSKGYKRVEEESKWNFVMMDEEGRKIDFHAFVKDEQGNIVDGVLYPVDSLTGYGEIEGYRVRCISPEYMITFKRGYTLREKDYQDIQVLCDTCEIEYPSHYIEWVEKSKHYP